MYQLRLTQAGVFGLSLVLSLGGITELQTENGEILTQATKQTHVPSQPLIHREILGLLTKEGGGPGQPQPRPPV